MNFFDMLKNLGALKSQMEAIQQRIKKITITGEAGAGMVRITMNGEGMATNISIEKSLLSPENGEMLEELIISAINDGLVKSREAAAHEMKSAVGVNLPPGFEKMFGG
jgi:hypothetical protein